MYLDLMQASRTHFLEMKDRAAVRYGVEHRHPFHDRRLIELAMAMPPEQLCRAGQVKVVVRRAMEDLVPPAVLERRCKAEFSHTLGELLATSEISGVFGSLRIAGLGWVERKQVARMCRELMTAWHSGAREHLPHSRALSAVLGVELWFRAAFGE
jgi:asparagine synthase (glutamine-hydrolysing)